VLQIACHHDFTCAAARRKKKYWLAPEPHMMLCNVHRLVRLKVHSHEHDGHLRPAMEARTKVGKGA